MKEKDWSHYCADSADPIEVFRARGDISSERPGKKTRALGQLYCPLHDFWAGTSGVCVLTCMHEGLVKRNELLHNNTADLKIIMLSVRAKHKKEYDSGYIKLSKIQTNA